MNATPSSNRSLDRYQSPPDAALATLALERGRRVELARRRSQALQAVLGRRSYGRAWAPDCADEELAAQLARLARQVRLTPRAGDVPGPIGSRCAHLPNIAIDLGEAAPDGAFDLIVVSRFDRFEHASDLTRAAHTLSAALAPRGELIAVHALGAPHALGAARCSRYLHVDAVHHLLLQHLPLQWRAGDRDGEFRLDAWVRSQ
jgi:hypothetical protein